MTDYSDAACVGHPPEWWHPETRGCGESYDRARPICQRCPIRTGCLADALAIERGHSDTRRHGMYGALDPGERGALERGETRPRRARPPALPGPGPGQIPREVLMARWAQLQAVGYSRLEAAQALGISKARLEKAIERTNARRGAA